MALAVLLYLLLSSPPHSVVKVNDNRIPAGTLHNGVLTLRLVAQEALWRPDGEKDPGVVAQVFGEAGKAPRVPGPLIRVPAGTRVRVTISNRIAGRTLKVHGFTARPATVEDTVVVPVGESRDVEFTLDTPGTYFYYGTTTDSTFGQRIYTDSQLNGAIVVDPPGAHPNDRVFVINEYTQALDPAGGPAEGKLNIAVINGKSWPHTEALTYARGDTVRWRLVNTSVAPHPMHLHGAYYLIHSRGTMLRDRAYAPDEQPQVVTDRMLPGGTMTLTWVPLHGGNWLFHCHVPLHVSPHLPINGVLPMAMSSGHMNHTRDGMGGLVLGITVSGDPNAPGGSGPVRRMRVVAQPDNGVAAGSEAYRFVLDTPDSASRAGLGLTLNPVLVLHRGEPTAITVVNTLHKPTAVHWHGIELESYYDGVAGFGGNGHHIAPVIEPGDSFVARFTPPRAGTFIYHTHVEELDQEPAGLAGMLLVLEPGQQFDAAHDHPLLLTTPRSKRRDDYVINGVEQPRAFEWQHGEVQHLRIINMTIGFPGGLAVSVMRDTTLMSWRATAKDGAPPPPKSSGPQPATVTASIGETFDFDVLLSEPGEYQVRVRALRAGRGPVRVIPIHVR